MSGTILTWIFYALIAVFVVAFVTRTVRLARLPIHLRWELAPVPHEKGKGHYGGSFLEEFEWWTKPRERSLVNEFAYMFQEIIFLKSVFENNRRLWWFSFPFHFGMYLLAAAALPMLLGAVLVEASGPAWSVFTQTVPILAGLGFTLGAVGGLGLVLIRFTDPKMKAVTTPASMFNLILLLAVFSSGGYALWISDGFAVGILGFITALFTATVPAEAPVALTVHLVVTTLFLAYLPFTPMMHFVAKYFTYHQIRWNDQPMVSGSDMEREVQGLLGRAVTWSGPHLKADGSKNWVDIATEGESNE
jgi:nitrate reductase gamma subunit